MHLNQMQVQMQMSTIQMQVQMQMRPPRGIQMQVQMQMPHLHLQVQMHLHLNTSLIYTIYILYIYYIIYYIYTIYRSAIDFYLEDTDTPKFRGRPRSTLATTLGDNLRRIGRQLCSGDVEELRILDRNRWRQLGRDIA